MMVVLGLIPRAVDKLDKPTATNHFSSLAPQDQNGYQSDGFFLVSVISFILRCHHRCLLLPPVNVHLKAAR